MGTTIRPEVSKKNEYWLDRHRYYELKHFCLQYKQWKTAYNAVPVNTSRIKFVHGVTLPSDPTERAARIRLYYSKRIKMLKVAAHKTDKALGSYVLKGVTEGISYDILKVKTNIPCSKDTYYKLYRRFFLILSSLRG